MLMCHVHNSWPTRSLQNVYLAIIGNLSPANNSYRHVSFLIEIKTAYSQIVGICSNDLTPWMLDLCWFTVILQFEDDFNFDLMGLCRGTASLRLLLAALLRTAPCIAGISLGTGGPAVFHVRCLWHCFLMTWRYGDTAQRCLFGIWSHGGGFPSCNPVLSTCSTHLSKLEFAFKIICYRSCFDIWNKYTRQEQKRLPANVWRWSSASRIFEIYVELGWIGAWNGGFLKWWIPKNE